MSAELKGYMEGAGAGVADTVAARMAELANAVFPMSPMERQPTTLALLGDRGVSLRGAEVGMSTSQHSTSDVTTACGFSDIRGCSMSPKCMVSCASASM